MEIAERVQAQEALRRSEWEKDILNRIANIFLSVPDDEMYGEVLTVVREAMSSRFGVFGFIADNGDLVVPSMTRDVRKECLVSDKSILFPSGTWGGSLWGKAMREKKTYYSDGPFHTPEGHIRIDNFLAAPIVFGDETIGLLSVANNEKGCNEEDQALLEKIAKTISPILSARIQRDRQENDLRRNEAINVSRWHLMQFAGIHSLDELLEETLNEAEKLTESLIGFYHFVDDDQESLTLQNWSTRTKAEFCRAEGKGLHYGIAEAGVWVDCVYQRKPVIHNDYVSLPHRKGMPKDHAEVVRELVVPVLRGSKIKAILGVGNKSSDYTEKDVEAIALLADLAWEIAERKLVDDALTCLNRELRAVSICNQILLRAVDEQALLTEICRIICDEAGYRLAWVGYAEDDEARTVRPVAWAGVEDGYLASANITWGDTERGRGPTGIAIRGGKSACIQDIARDPLVVPWREKALQCGYRSILALPLKDEKANIFGALTIYSGEPEAFTAEEIRLMEELAGDLAFGIDVLRNRAQRKQAEEERLVHLRFFEGLDKINRAMQGTNDLDRMMRDVLDVVLALFDCDRAFLLYPCDPNTVLWTVPMGRNKPEYPGVRDSGVVIPMDAEVAEMFRILLAADGPVKFGVETGRPLPAEVSESFGQKSSMSMALYPKVGKPWQFGIHQCSYPRIWTPEEERLFQEIGRRLSDALTSLLSYRNLIDSEVMYRSLKNYLANIIDSMPSVLVGMDRHQVVTQWNRKAEEMSGIPAPEAIGRPLAELFPDFFPWISTMGNEINKQHPASMERLLIEKEGQRRFYDLMLYPLITNGEEGGVLRIEDVTERSRIQDLMVQTEKMMSVGGLAAGLAHEINNPLGIITQAVQNIERRVSPDLPANRKAAEEIGVSLEEIEAYFEKRQIPEFIGSIRTASIRAARIVANMLQFSRNAGIILQSASLAGIMDQALELAASDYDLKKKYDFRSIEIIRDYGPDMPEVPVVSVEIEQVMLNLLKNAAQAMIVNPPDRKPRIRLGLYREEKYAVIEVEDNGPGMGEEIRRRVFEPFFTTKEPGIGTGLGLSVSYMIVTQNHKGLMEAASTPGKGACFRVSLPLSKESIYE